MDHDSCELNACTQSVVVPEWSVRVVYPHSVGIPVGSQQSHCMLTCRVFDKQDPITE